MRANRGGTADTMMRDGCYVPGRVILFLRIHSAGDFCVWRRNREKDGRGEPRVKTDTAKAAEKEIGNDQGSH